MTEMEMTAYMRELVTVAQHADWQRNPWDKGEYEAIAPAVAAKVLRDLEQDMVSMQWFIRSWAKERGIDLGDTA